MNTPKEPVDLHAAIKSGEIDAVKAILEKHPDAINLPDGEFERTPLHTAIWAGNPEIIRFLLENGADPNIQDRFGYNALHTASARLMPEIVEELLKKGVDPNVQTYLEGGASLHLIWANGKPAPDMIKVAEKLLSAGINPNATDQHGNTPLHNIFMEMHKHDDENKKPFIDAALMLIEKGADPHIVNSDGLSAIDLACAYSTFLGDMIKDAYDKHLDTHQKKSARLGL